MSWLLKSLQINDPNSEDDDDTPLAGARQEKSVITETIGRQLRGVADFLAPPPVIAKKEEDQVVVNTVSTSSFSSQKKLIGVRNDLAEIGEGFKTGISKIASNLLPFRNDGEEEDEADDDDDDHVPGITEDVIDFVHKISLRPEYWTGFPLSLDNDFEMSDDQKEHAMAAERLVPTLATLRANTQSCMEDEKFWLIYFILLLPRLDENDFELLSTPKIVETRNALLQKLESKKNEQSKAEISSGTNTSQQGKDNILPGGIETQEYRKSIKSIIYATEGLRIDDKQNTTDSDKQNTTDTDTGSIVHVETDENISFSDLEDEDSDFPRRHSVNREKSDGRGSSPNESNDWVQLNSSVPQGGVNKARHSVSRDSEGESSDWQAVDEFD